MAPEAFHIYCRLICIACPCVLLLRFLISFVEISLDIIMYLHTSTTLKKLRTSVQLWPLHEYVQVGMNGVRHFLEDRTAAITRGHRAQLKKLPPAPSAGFGAKVLFMQRSKTPTTRCRALIDEYPPYEDDTP